MPPTKPTLPVFDVLAAITPTRNEPSCSLNTIDCTLGLSTTMSMMPNLVLGNSSATLPSAVAQAKPDSHDRREAVLGEFAQHLLALRVVLDLEVAEVDAGVLLELGRAVEDALVEGFVELAAEVIDDRGLDRRRHRRRRRRARRANRAVVRKLELRPNILNLPVMARAEVRRAPDAFKKLTDWSSIIPATSSAVNRLDRAPALFEPLANGRIETMRGIRGEGKPRRKIALDFASSAGARRRRLRTVS